MEQKEQAPQPEPDQVRIMDDTRSSTFGHVGKTPIRFVFLMFETVLSQFGIDMASTTSAQFCTVKLDLRLEDWISMITTSYSISYFLDPIGGLLTDTVPNKFYLVVFGGICLFVSDMLFILLAFPMIRHSVPDLWTLMYAKQSLIHIGYILSSTARTAFTIDQFRLPEEQLILRKFLGIQMILKDIVRLVATIGAPFLRSQFSCFHEQDCYAIPFMIGLVLRFMSIVVLVVGYRFYIINIPQRRLVIKSVPCLIKGLKMSIKNRKTDPKEHWLDHAKPVYGAELVEDLKSLIRIYLFMILLPLREAADIRDNVPDFALIQGIKFILFGYRLEPETVDLLECLIKIVTVPFIMIFMEPRLRGTRMDRPYRWILCGAVFLAFAQLYDSVLLTKIIDKYPELPHESEAQVRIYNSAECPAVVKLSKFWDDTLIIDAYGGFTDKHVPVLAYETYKLKVSGSCFDTVSAGSFVEGGQAISVYIKQTGRKIEVISYIQKLINDLEEILPDVYIVGSEAMDSLFLEDSRGVTVHLEPELTKVADQLKVTPGPRVMEVYAGRYKLYHNGLMVMELEMDLGGIYHILLMGKTAKLSVIAPPNEVHMLWMIPSLVALVVSDYFLEIGGMEFVYMEMPLSLRGTTEALNCLLLGCGNLLAKLMANDWRHDYQKYLSAILTFISYLVPLVFVLKMRSRHPGRKLV